MSSWLAKPQQCYKNPVGPQVSFSIFSRQHADSLIDPRGLSPIKLALGLLLVLTGMDSGVLTENTENNEVENSAKECSAFLYQRWPLEGGTVHPAVSHIGLKQKRKNQRRSATMFQRDI